jgi:uncharacterized membrane protein
VVAVASARPALSGSRLAAIDILRGLAILGMIVYHASWDLRENGLISADVVGDPGWRWFSHIVAGSFLALVGVNLVLSTRNGIGWDRYLRRLALIIASAALVSAVTVFWVPNAPVFFGILHLIALGSVLALPFLSAPARLTAIVSAACLAAPSLLASDFFDGRAWWWLGLSAEPPTMVDYVPVLPWFGVLLAGVVAGRLLVGGGGLAALGRFNPSGFGARAIAFLGRWSLLIYLIHQPILFGLLYGLVSLPLPELQSRRLTNFCVGESMAGGLDEAGSEGFCGCVVDGAKAAGLVGAVLDNTLDPLERDQWEGMIAQCQPAEEPTPPVD